MSLKILIISYKHPIENGARATQLLGILDLLISEQFEIDLVTRKLDSDTRDHFRYKLYRLDRIKMNEINEFNFESRFSIYFVRFINRYFPIEHRQSFSLVSFIEVLKKHKVYDYVVCISNPFSVAFIGYMLNP